MNKTHTPVSPLLDHLLSKLEGKKNDAQLSYRLRVAPPVISKLRNGRLELGDCLRLRITEEFDMPPALVRELAGLPAYVRGA